MDVNERIKAILVEHPVVLFMKGTPAWPMCDFSARAARALTATGARFQTVNVQAAPQIRSALPQFSNLSTFPQLFVQGELMGGCDVIEELHQAGELDRMMADVLAVP